MLNQIMIFDIETIPDTQTGGLTHDWPSNLSTAERAQAMQSLHQQKTGSTFLPHYLQQVVAISVVLKTQQQVKVWSLGEEDSDEKDIIERFFAGLEKYLPTLVSWNGSGFDLPVLHYRALKHGIPAPIYWDTGELDQKFKWNNYTNRYHHRHTDLLDMLAGFQGRAMAPLDQVSLMLGYPGKMGMSGDKVLSHYLKGDIQSIRDYCETDVLNTYLVYIRFEYIRGHLSKKAYTQAYEELKEMLDSDSRQHIQAFGQELPNSCFDNMSDKIEAT